MKNQKLKTTLENIIFNKDKNKTIVNFCLFKILTKIPAPIFDRINSDDGLQKSFYIEMSNIYADLKTSENFRTAILFDDFKIDVLESKKTITIEINQND